MSDKTHNNAMYFLLKFSMTISQYKQ